MIGSARRVMVSVSLLRHARWSKRQIPRSWRLRLEETAFVGEIPGLNLAITIDNHTARRAPRVRQGFVELVKARVVEAANLKRQIVVVGLAGRQIIGSTADG